MWKRGESLELGDVVQEEEEEEEGVQEEEGKEEGGIWARWAQAPREQLSWQFYSTSPTTLVATLPWMIFCRRKSSP